MCRGTTLALTVNKETVLDPSNGRRRHRLLEFTVAAFKVGMLGIAGDLTA
jgi:hypothetical protein